MHRGENLEAVSFLLYLWWKGLIGWRQSLGESQALSPCFVHAGGVAGEGRKHRRRKRQPLLSRDCCSPIWPELPWAASKAGGRLLSTQGAFRLGLHLKAWLAQGYCIAFSNLASFSIQPYKPNPPANVATLAKCRWYSQFPSGSWAILPW